MSQNETERKSIITLHNITKSQGGGAVYYFTTRSVDNDLKGPGDHNTVLLEFGLRMAEIVEELEGNGANVRITIETVPDSEVLETCY